MSVAMSRAAQSPNRAHFGAIPLGTIELTHRSGPRRAIERVETEPELADGPRELPDSRRTDHLRHLVHDDPQIAV